MTGLTGLRRFAAAGPARSSGSAARSGQADAERTPPSARRDAAGPAAAAEVDERCELCATEMEPGHGHIADLQAASLLCACRACYLLFTRPNASGSRYLAVPDRYLHDPDRAMTGAEFDRLEIPVGLVFFLRTSRDGALTGFYPSPAGVTECRLDLDRWQELAASHPLLCAPAADVEATLVSRTADRVEYYLVPVDVCYELAGRMRMAWRGFDGGSEARQHIADFLAAVRQRARPMRSEHG